MKVINMEFYIGTTKVNASPMSRKEYDELRGWETSKFENGAEPGYLVEHMDGSRANTNMFKGYISWMPKEHFESIHAGNACLSFSHALMLMTGDNDRQMARDAWDGESIYYVGANEQRGWENDSEYRPYIQMSNADGSTVPWNPTHTDLLAHDWYVLD